MKSLSKNSLVNRGNELLISISGIRGTIPHGLDPENIVPFMRAFAEISGNKIIIARDTRPSGFFLNQLVIGTLLASSKKVIDIGIAPTPSLKYAVNLYQADAGIMITASHNPIIWNGFKFIDKGGLFYTKHKQANWLKALLSKSNQKKNYSSIKSLGSYHSFGYEAIKSHINTVLNYTSNLQKIQEKKYKVVVDAVNGAGVVALPILLEKLACKVITMNCETKEAMQKFPRPPEPTPLALKKLSSLVKKHKASLGFALDPDADRLAIVAPKRGAVSEEYTLALSLSGLDSILKARAKLSKANNFVFNLSTSSLCDCLASQYNAKVFRSAVGESNVVELMQKKKAIFGGEGNGGVIIPAIPSFGRDPLIGAALILSAMARENAKNVDDLLNILPPLFMKKAKYTLGDINFENLADKFLLEFAAAAKVDHRDGLYLKLSERNWLHLRPSNTEPCLRLIIEAKNANELNKISNISKKILNSFSLKSQF